MRKTLILSTVVGLMTLAPAIAADDSSDRYGNPYDNQSQYDQNQYDQNQYNQNQYDRNYPQQDDRDRYNRSRSYDRDSSDNDYSSDWRTRGERLSEVTDAAGLADARVRDSSGRSVGRVVDIDVGTNGYARNIKVALNDGREMVILPARGARFDRDRDTVRTDLSWDQIRRMAREQQS